MEGWREGELCGSRVRDHSKKEVKWSADFNSYIDTPLLDSLPKAKLIQVFDFAIAEDAVKAVLKVATDQSVNGRPRFFTKNN